MASQSGQSIEDATRRVYQHTWNDFYAWEQNYCAESIRSLGHALHPRTNLSHGVAYQGLHIASWGRFSLISGRDAGGQHARLDPLVENSSSAPNLLFYDLESDDLPPASISLDVIEIPGISPKPQPPYESTAPLHRNIRHGDDSNDVQFIPYADAEFDWRTYVLEHKKNSWQSTQQDPDQSMIHMEIARTLFHHHSVSLTEVDALRILPLVLCSTPTQTGLLSTVTQSDYIPWPEPQERLLPPDTMTPPERHHLQRNLQKMVPLFCADLSCTHALCVTHWIAPNNEIDAHPLDWEACQQVAESKPTDPCGPYCFSLTITEDKQDPSLAWTPVENAELRLILALDPSATSCALAVVLRKSCKEVQAHIFRLLRAEKSVAEGTAAQFKRKSVSRRVNFNDEYGPTSWTPISPCQHAGPCSSATKCDCFRAKLHCQRNCSCANDCIRRWRGCKCGTSDKPGSKTCGEKCPCFVAQRECNPELCMTCDFRTHLGSASEEHGNPDSCRNCQLQRDLSKAVEVKQGKWGQGLFMCENARKDDLIIEYLGEMIFRPTFETRDLLASFRGRAYVYGLNEEFDLDGSFAGNVSRVINHAPGKEANCVARTSLVNGDHRMGIYAVRNITPGTEIFLDYGPDFFH